MRRDIEVALVDVERRRQVENGSVRLSGHHTSGGERPPVADAVYLEPDRLIAGSAPDEVRMQGVGFIVRIDRVGRGLQRLRDHLAAIDTTPGVPPALPHVDIGTVRLEAHQLLVVCERLFDRIVHGGSLTARGEHHHWRWR